MVAVRCTRHEHRGPQDYRPDGRCIHCQREAQRRYQSRKSAAYAAAKQNHHSNPAVV